MSEYLCHFTISVSVTLLFPVPGDYLPVHVFANNFVTLCLDVCLCICDQLSLSVNSCVCYFAVGEAVCVTM